MRDEPARFRGEAEILRHRIAPRRERFQARHAIEAAVDLRGREAVLVEIEKAACGQLRRIERPKPMLVVPAGRADMDGACGHGRTTPRWQRCSRAGSAVP